MKRLRLLVQKCRAWWRHVNECHYCSRCGHRAGEHIDPYPFPPGGCERCPCMRSRAWVMENF